jgi:hypothetical protein
LTWKREAISTIASEKTVFIDHVAEYQPGGLDQCQARLYTAIMRHVVLVMAALAVCAVTAAQFRDRTDTQAPPPGHAARRLHWRRRHQARSRWFHQRARLARNYALVS